MGTPKRKMKIAIIKTDIKQEELVKSGGEKWRRRRRETGNISMSTRSSLDDKNNAYSIRLLKGINKII